jgi:mono/diheme cytochrome c family protein
MKAGHRMTQTPLKLVCAALSCAAILMFAQSPAATSAPKPDTARGKLVFDDNCADCHYRDSKEEKVGPGLEGLSKGSLPSGRKATHDRILDIINTGPAEMTSFKDRLTEQEKEDVVAYVMTL